MAGVTAVPAASAAGAMRPKADLSLIAGIGQATLKKLGDMGVTLRQIAEWNADDIDRYGDSLKNPNIRSERWVEQAQQLLIANGDEMTEPPVPAPAKTRAELIAGMKKAPTIEPEPEVDEPGDPLAGLSPDEIAALARKAVAAEVPKSTADLQKRGSVKHLHRTSDAPSFVAFNRERGVLQRLNRNKKFAFINGDFHGAHFSQRGRYFDHEGIEIPFNADGRPLNDSEIAELYVDEEVVVTDPDDVNLPNWYERKVDYPLELVIKAIQRTYRKKFDTEPACRIFLHQVLRANVG